MQQAGYRVVFIPFQAGVPTGLWTDFVVPSTAPNAIRPVGVAAGPDGTLYLAGDANQKIWRIMRRPPAP
jgi:glucose/arabinose dehydrogenase